MARPPYSRLLGAVSGSGTGYNTLVAEVPSGLVYVVTWASMYSQPNIGTVRSDIALEDSTPVMGLQNPYDPDSPNATVTDTTRAVLTSGRGLFVQVTDNHSNSWFVVAYGFVLTDDGGA